MSLVRTLALVATLCSLQPGIAIAGHPGMEELDAMPRVALVLGNDRGGIPNSGHAPITDTDSHAIAMGLEYRGYKVVRRTVLRAADVDAAMLEASHEARQVGSSLGVLVIAAGTLSAGSGQLPTLDGEDSTVRVADVLARFAEIAFAARVAMLDTTALAVDGSTTRQPSGLQRPDNGGVPDGFDLVIRLTREPGDTPHTTSGHGMLTVALTKALLQDETTGTFGDLIGTAFDAYERMGETLRIPRPEIIIRGQTILSVDVTGGGVASGCSSACDDSRKSAGSESGTAI